MANCTIVTIKNARVRSEQVPVSDRSSAEWCALLRAAAEVGKIGAEETVPCCVLVSQEHPRQQGCPYQHVEPSTFLFVNVQI